MGTKKGLQINANLFFTNDKAHGVRQSYSKYSKFN